MRPRIGISSCLLGENVRFDGGHKRDRFLTDTLGRFCEWVPVCPEVEVGLGIPRESLRLIGEVEQPRIIAPASGKDWTRPMASWARRRAKELVDVNLHGFILKKGSPSCGMERVRVYHQGGGGAEWRGTGLWARELSVRFPLLPLEEEGRLNDPHLRENFIERVFAYDRWVRTFSSRSRPRDLVRFHTIHKMTLLSHSQAHYRRLGKLVAEAGKRPLRPFVEAYGKTFMEALRLRATPRKHANVMQHLQGFLKNELDKDDKAELGEAIEAYRIEQVPLIVPLTLLKHHLRRHPVEWALQQTYLNPYPAELMLRNHV
ncbi:MAG: YbgA family protein [Planctomycetota bacterium]